MTFKQVYLIDLYKFISAHKDKDEGIDWYGFFATMYDNVGQDSCFNLCWDEFGLDEESCAEEMVFRELAIKDGIPHDAKDVYIHIYW